MQRTWKSYDTVAATTAAAPQIAETAEAKPPLSEDDGVAADTPLVPSEALADGFGYGYGDMSDALAAIQQELTESSSAVVTACAGLVAFLPISIAEEAPEGEKWPSPARAWKLAAEWQLDSHPIIAVDIVMPFELAPEECEHLAKLWLPH